MDVDVNMRCMDVEVNSVLHHCISFSEQMENLIFVNSLWLPITDNFPPHAENWVQTIKTMEFLILLPPELLLLFFHPSIKPFWGNKNNIIRGFDTQAGWSSSQGKEEEGLKWQVDQLSRKQWRPWLLAKFKRAANLLRGCFIAFLKYSAERDEIKLQNEDCS